MLLLDEPFASLDAITRAEMQEWLAEVLAGESRTTVLLVTHDVEEALYLSDRVLVLSRAAGRASVAELAAPGPRANAAARGRHLAGLHRRPRARARALRGRAMR